MHVFHLIATIQDIDFASYVRQQTSLILVKGYVVGQSHWVVKPGHSKCLGVQHA